MDGFDLGIKGDDLKLKLLHFFLLTMLSRNMLLNNEEEKKFSR